MTHRGGLSLSIIIWRIGGGRQASFCPGAKNSLGGPVSNFHGLSTNTSIRQAAHLQSMGDEQGFVKCICKTACARKTCKYVR
jgi:hypothetical protein